MKWTRQSNTKLDMKSTLKITLFLFMGFTLLSCSKPSPRKYVEVAVLNTNLVTGSYTPQFFDELQELKNQNRITLYKDGEMKQVTVEEYVRQRTIVPVNEAMAKAEALPETDDSRDLKAASLEVFKYGKQLFEKEYLVIAQMLDDNKAQTEIDSAIQKIFTSHDAEMEKRIRYLDELAIPYAKKHNVPLEYR